VPYYGGTVLLVVVLMRQFGLVLNGQWLAVDIPRFHVCSALYKMLQLLLLGKQTASGISHAAAFYASCCCDTLCYQVKQHGDFGYTRIVLSYMC
jgi:hypothetical protein